MPAVSSISRSTTRDHAGHEGSLTEDVNDVDTADVHRVDLIGVFQHLGLRERARPGFVDVPTQLGDLARRYAAHCADHVDGEYLHDAFGERPCPEVTQHVAISRRIGDQPHAEIEDRERFDDVVEVSGHGAEMRRHQLTPVVLLTLMAVLCELQQSEGPAVVQNGSHPHRSS